MYYNKKEEIIYVESFEFFQDINKTIEGNGEITRTMINELTEYLGWKNWSIKLYYYDYEEAMITIRLKKDTKSHNDQLKANSLINDFKQKIMKKPIIDSCGNYFTQIRRN